MCLLIYLDNLITGIQIANASGDNELTLWVSKKINYSLVFSIIIIQRMIYTIYKLYNSIDKWVI